jgi:hypothetical protein
MLDKITQPVQRTINHWKKNEMKIKFMRKLLMHARSFQFSRVLKWLF